MNRRPITAAAIGALTVGLACGLLRVAAQTPVITGFTPDGMLVWSNGAASGTSHVLRSTNLAANAWETVASFANTGLQASAQLSLSFPLAFFQVRYDTNGIPPPPVDVVYVSRDAGGADDGSSWTDAYTNFQQGVEGASPSNQVWVQQGVYRVAGPVALKPYLEVYGGFAGNETALEARDWTANRTAIDGGGGPGFTGADYARLDGFTIMGCSNAADGVVLLAARVAPSVYNCVISNNTGGAALSFTQLGDTTDKQSVVQGCLFTENTGGAIHYWGRAHEGRVGPHRLRVDRCVFARNTTAGGGGGVLAFYAGDWVEIYNSLFVANRALNGGALYLENRQQTYIPVTHCTFVDNVASNAGHTLYGTHIYTFGSPSRIEMLNCVVWGRDENAIFINGHKNFPSNLRAGYSDLQNGTASIVFATANAGTLTDLGGIITNNPAFAAPASDDYRLQAGSPALDAGTNGLPAALDVDLDGLPRPAGPAPDLGAYERQP